MNDEGKAKNAVADHGIDENKLIDEVQRAIASVVPATSSPSAAAPVVMRCLGTITATFAVMMQIDRQTFVEGVGSYYDSVLQGVMGASRPPSNLD